MEVDECRLREQRGMHRRRSSLGWEGHRQVGLERTERLGVIRLHPRLPGTDLSFEPYENGERIS